MALIGRVAVALMLTGCGAAGDPGNSQSADRAAPAPSAEQILAARETERVVASWQPARFDLVCSGRGRVVWTGDFPGSRSPNAQEWDAGGREIVDLEAMRSCDPVTCRRYGPRPIQEVTEDAINFTDGPTFRHTYNRRDGRLHVHNFDSERLEVTEGDCRIEPFSGFPAVVPGY